jgi:hypothetical protein
MRIVPPGRWMYPFLLVTALSIVPGEPSSGQVPDTIPPRPSAEIPQDQPPDSVLAPVGITPRGAFLRSILVPGWGHAEVGSYVRGGFYFAAQSATVFMIVKTHSRLARAGDRLELMELVVRRRLEASGTTDPGALETAVGQDPLVEDLRALESSRSEQRQDWMALGIFLVFLGGADAFVSAHLADFPAAVEIVPTPGGGLEIGFSVPVGFRP